MKGLLSKRWLLHAVFWALTYYLLYRIFATSSEILRIDLIYTGVFIFTLLPAIYLNLELLIPRLLGRGAYFWYGLAVASVLAFSVGFNILVFSRLIDYVLPGYYFISYYDFFDLLKFNLALVFITTLLKLSKGWFELAESRKRLAEVEKENIHARLMALRSQVNPHFLFNSLSGIHSLVLKQSPETAGVVLRLSDFLRYILYEVNAEQVSLSGELSAMKDYVELQRLRSQPGTPITFEVDGDPEGYRIAPLLFLPLLENSFKHGIKGSAANAHADFHFRIGEHSLTARFVNNAGTADEPMDKQFKGIGLDNLQQRLELLYPGKFTFSCHRSDTAFVVDLIVPLYE